MLVIGAWMMLALAVIVILFVMVAISMGALTNPDSNATTEMLTVLLIAVLVALMSGYCIWV